MKFVTHRYMSVDGFPNRLKSSTISVKCTRKTVIQTSVYVRYTQKMIFGKTQKRKRWFYGHKYLYIN